MVPEKLIPWDKSWLIRMGVLDMLRAPKRQDLPILDFLDKHEAELGDDLQALRQAALLWRETGIPIDVGESGTLFRFLQFASWKYGLDKQFIKRGTLKDRRVTDDPAIVELRQTELLQLDNGTTQWASAAVLCGDNERMMKPPHKLALTYEADVHWWRCNTTNVRWDPRKDETIRAQAEAFDRLMQGKPAMFKAAQAEDFCFAYAFCNMTAWDGQRRWPSLRGHESDRIVEMEVAMAAARAGDFVESRDHRVVQAAVMWCMLNRRAPFVRHLSAVAKSWPQFWDFIGQYH